MAAIEPVQLTASILSADLNRLGEQVEGAMNAGVRLIHVDVMDGLFGQGSVEKIFPALLHKTLHAHCPIGDDFFRCRSFLYRYPQAFRPGQFIEPALAEK